MLYPNRIFAKQLFLRSTLLLLMTILTATRFARQGMGYSPTRVARYSIAKMQWGGDFYSRFAS